MLRVASSGYLCLCTHVYIWCLDPTLVNVITSHKHKQQAHARACRHEHVFLTRIRTHAGTVDPVTLSSMMSQLDFSGLLLVQQTTLLSATSTAAAGRGEPLFLLRRTEKAHLAFKNHRTGELDVWSAVQRRLADAKATAAAAATAAATADARDADSSSANLGVSFDHSIGDTSDLAHQSILERDNAHKREKDAAPLQRIPATADDGQQSASMYQQRGPFDDDSESTALLCRTPASGSVYTARILEMNSGVSSGMLPTLLAELLAQQAW